MEFYICFCYMPSTRYSIAAAFTYVKLDMSNFTEIIHTVKSWLFCILMQLVKIYYLYKATTEPKLWWAYISSWCRCHHSHSNGRLQYKLAEYVTVLQYIQNLASSICYEDYHKGTKANPCCFDYKIENVNIKCRKTLKIMWKLCSVSFR
jgi:hypothetical protein